MPVVCSAIEASDPHSPDLRATRARLGRREVHLVAMQREHPIIELALNASIELGTAYADRVKKKLLEIKTGEELEHAVLTLVSAAKFAEDRKQPKAADKILAIAFTAIEPLKTFSARARQLAEDLTRA